MATSTGRTYRGQSPEVRAAERRRKLLDAALQAFGTEGYAATSVPGLCASAGVSPKHFYEQFSSREEVLRELYDEIIAEVGGGAAAALAADGELEDRVRAGLRHFTGPLVADERKARVNFLEVVGVSPELEVHRREVLRGFAALIADAVRRLVDPAQLEGRDLDTVSMALVGATNEPLIDWFALPKRRRPPLDGVIDELARVYAGAFR